MKGMHKDSIKIKCEKNDDNFYLYVWIENVHSFSGLVGSF